MEGFLPSSPLPLLGAEARTERRGHPWKAFTFAQTLFNLPTGEGWAQGPSVGPSPEEALVGSPCSCCTRPPLARGNPEREPRRRSQSPDPLQHGPALPTSSAWLEKVVSEGLGREAVEWGWRKGRHLIDQTRPASQTGTHAKPQDDLRAAF